MFPRIVDVEFSSYCNLKCGFCFGPTDDRTVKNLPTDFWLRVLDWIAKHGASGIVVSGGEPTMLRDIPQLLRHAKDLGLSVVLSTHGQFKDRLLECAPYVDWMAIPLDGLSSEIQFAMRGSLWGLEEAATRIRELHSQFPRVHIKLGTVATSVNLAEIPLIGGALIHSSIGIATWKIYQYTPRRQFKHRWREFHISDSEYASLCRDVTNSVPSHDFDIIFSSNRSRQRAYLFIYPDGTVAVPNVGPDMDDLVIGNLVLEGEEVLDRVEGISWRNHEDNYDSTYPNGRGDTPFLK